MSKPTLKVTSDFTKQVNDAVKKFRHDSLLVGIPEDDNARKEDPASQEIGNAALLAITEFGSPAANIPAWPVMSIGLRNVRDEVADIFASAAREVLAGALKGKNSLEVLERQYSKAGIIASVSIKKVINAQEGAPPLSEITLAARASAGFKGTSRGIVTGQMRNAITYVVKGKAS